MNGVYCKLTPQVNPFLFFPLFFLVLSLSTPPPYPSAPRPLYHSPQNRLAAGPSRDRRGRSREAPSTMISARPKYSTTAPAGFSASLPENPRKEFRSPAARPSGRSGGGAVSTPHRISSSRRRARAGGRK
jgi:hypothetical protein